MRQAATTRKPNAPTLAGSHSEAIHSIVRFGIALLEEGNHLVQGEMLTQLRAMDVGFLSSVAHLVASCSVLDWSAYQRYQISEMMQSSSSLGMFPILYVECFRNGNGMTVCIVQKLQAMNVFWLCCLYHSCDKGAVWIWLHRGSLPLPSAPLWGS